MPCRNRNALSGRNCNLPKNRHLQKAFQQDEAIHRRVLEFVQAQAHALSQVAGCHRTHGASQRLTRCLLHAQDLTESSAIDITQETLSELLGTKRVTIAAAAGDLQKQGLIEYRRGHIHILKRSGLEAVACDCYLTLKELHEGLYSS